MASIYFDLCDYEKSSVAFGNALNAIKDPGEHADVREQYARALFRAKKYPESLAQYSELLKEDNSPLGKEIAALMVFYLNFQQGKSESREFPDAAKRFIFSYEKLTDDERKNLSKSDLAKATWIYYVKGLMNQAKGAPDVAVVSFAAAANSPDDTLAGEAGYQAGMMYFELKNFDKAKESFEYVLFSTKSTEASVKATYMLGVCFDKLEKPDKALERFKQIVERYPVSPYVELVKKNPIYEAGVRKQAGPSNEKGQ